MATTAEEDMATATSTTIGMVSLWPRKMIHTIMSSSSTSSSSCSAGLGKSSSSSSPSSMPSLSSSFEWFLDTTARQQRIDNISENEYYHYLQDCCGSSLEMLTGSGSASSSTASLSSLCSSTVTAATTETTATYASCTCPVTSPLWLRIVRWIIRIVLKPYAPFLYMAITMFIGILIGFCIGRYWETLQAKLKNGLQTKGLQLLLWIYGATTTTTTTSHGNDTIDNDDIAPAKAHAYAHSTIPTNSSSFTTRIKKTDASATSTNSTNITTTNVNGSTTSQVDAIPVKQKQEDRVRQDLLSNRDLQRESNVDMQSIPTHVAVIMDGNRRYGKMKYGSAQKGHWDGCNTLCEFAKWCVAEGIQILTVYAFSTENWNRSPEEVATLMSLFAKYCEELRLQAIQRNIRLCVLSTETDRIPHHVMVGLQRMEEDTKHCRGGLTMNICLSYGSRGEIVNACRSIAQEVLEGQLDLSNIDEHTVESKLLTTQSYCGDTHVTGAGSSTSSSSTTATNPHNPQQQQQQHLQPQHYSNPDIVIRTSGEYRLSNFLLWQLAYSEMFFLSKSWPELQKQDLIDVIRTYAQGRSRRFGK